MTWKSILLISLILIALTPSITRLDGDHETAIVELRMPTPEAFRQLSKWGEVDSVIGGIATLRAHPAMLEHLRKSGMVEAVYAPRKFRPVLEYSTLDIGLPNTLAKSGLNVERVDGRGVLLAVIDTGIDYQHPAFLDRFNRSRVLYIWDQTIEGKPPEGFGYGYECGPDEINDGICPEVDTNGHGTHVSSIAAGNSGVARGASILVVKSGSPTCGGSLWTFDEKEILDGIAYAVSKSKTLGMRLVVNLSLGSDTGGHDGGSPLEKALDRLVDEDVVVVVAAGNSASDGRHVRGTVLQGGTVNLRWSIPSETAEFYLSFATNPEERLGLRLSRPGGGALPLSGNMSTNWMDFKISVEEYPGLSIRHTLVTVSGPVTGGWLMEVAGLDVLEGVFHAWLESDTCSSSRETFTAGDGYDISEDFTVSIPGTAEKVITVGAYMTRNSWRAQSGRTVELGGTVGTLEFYSGRGPTTDGRIKPDIVAPGGVILAARSHQAADSPINPSPLERAGRGTSMATPHVAGVAALILQLAPYISADHVDDVVRMTARNDNFTGEIPASGSPLWGWGKLNADIAYTLEVRLSGLNEEMAAILSINGTELPLTKGVGAVILPKAAQVDLTLLPQVSLPGLRVEASPQRLRVSEAGSVSFTVSRQYLVTVYDSDGEELFSGWVPHGTVLDLGALAGDEGQSQFSLVRRTVVGYLSDSGGAVGELVSVDRPMEITVVSVVDYTNLFLVTIASAAAPASIYLAYILMKHRKIRAEGG
ncbi:MAG: S8 family serine peptidase [Nitrososphaerota archaeon]